ncbi:unnamed protein product, partial [Hapterophycus canaliculatus]
SLTILVQRDQTRRSLRGQDLTSADVVLTTYAIVENEHRKAYAGNKVPCPDCGRT